MLCDSFYLTTSTMSNYVLSVVLSGTSGFHSRGVYHLYSLPVWWFCLTQKYKPNLFTDIQSTHLLWLPPSVNIIPLFLTYMEDLSLLCAL